MTVKALVIGAVLVLTALFSPAYADDGNGRYTIVPIPGHNGVILLDTRTGQNWFSADAEKTNHPIFGERGPSGVRLVGVELKTFNWLPNRFFTLTGPPTYLPPSPPSENPNKK